MTGHTTTSSAALGRALTLLTPPPIRPVTLDQVKDHLRVELDDVSEDATIDALIDAAIADFDGAGGWLGRALITQSWTMKLDRFPYLPSQAIRMPLPPLQSVDQVDYIDLDYQSQTWDPSNYQVDVDSTVGRLKPARNVEWPSVPTDELQPITITFTAGYGDNPQDVPKPIVSAILLHVGNYFANRETVVVGTIASRLPIGIERLVYRFRVGGWR